MKRILSITASLFLAMNVSAADVVKLTVQNPLSTIRNGEMAEVAVAPIIKKLDGAKQFIVTDADGKEIPSQVTYDGKLIFQIGVGAKGKVVYYAKKGTPQKYENRVFGRQYPERVDDFAWENDRVAFRAYGPALQKSGERAWGYDIWTKNTDRLVLEERYALEKDAEFAKVCTRLRKMGYEDLATELYYAQSYHVNHGTGMDCYKVGPTLGGGTAALLANGGKDIVYPKCYTIYEILDRGPLRFTFSLSYEKTTVEGQTFTEKRVISLDAGSQMNHAVITYEGITKAIPAAVGVIVHNENPNAFVLNDKEGFMAYEDLGDPYQYKEKFRAKLNKEFGQIYVGVVCMQKGVKMEYRQEANLPGATGHILAIGNYQPKATLDYYFGSAWSHNESVGINSIAKWEAYLQQFAKTAHNPLKVTVK